MRTLFVVVTLLAVVVLAACAVLLGNRARAAERVVSLFKRPQRPPKALGSSHYYRRYWSAGPKPPEAPSTSA